MKLWLPGPSDKTIRIRLIEGELIAGVCLVVATVIAAVSDFGDDADLSYYGTVAQVIPVVLLAMMVEITTRLHREYRTALGSIDENRAQVDELTELERRVRERGADTERLARARAGLREIEEQTEELHSELRGYVPEIKRIVRGYVVIAVPGEAACLLVLAAGEGCTFALWVSALSLLAMTGVYIRSLGTHFDFHE